MFFENVYKRRLKAMEERLNDVEQSNSDIAVELSHLRASLTRLLAKSSVEAREGKKKSPSAEDVLAELLGGRKLVGISEDKEKGEKQI